MNREAPFFSAGSSHVEKLKELDSKVPGCLSKRIAGRMYLHLSWRAGDKVKSRYFKKAEASDLLKYDDLRKEFRKILKGIREDLALIGKVVKPNGNRKPKRGPA